MIFQRFFFFVMVMCLVIGTSRQSYAEKDMILHAPTSSWLVGPSSAQQLQAAPESSENTTSAEDIVKNIPCVMLVQYINGYSFRFAGAYGRVLTMAIDFRSPIFTPGDFYKLKLRIPPSYDLDLLGKAHNNYTLIFNLKDEPLFEKNLREGEYMQLKFVQKSQNFVLSGQNDGLDRLNACFKDNSILNTSDTPNTLLQENNP